MFNDSLTKVLNNLICCLFYIILLSSIFFPKESGRNPFLPLSSRRPLLTITKTTFNKILAIYIVMALLSCMFILLFWIWPPGPLNIFLLRVAANVSAFVVGSNPTGICTLCKNTPGMGLFTDTLHLLL